MNNNFHIFTSSYWKSDIEYNNKALDVKRRTVLCKPFLDYLKSSRLQWSSKPADPLYRLLFIQRVNNDWREWKKSLLSFDSSWSRDAIGPKGTDGTHGTQESCLFYDDSCQPLTISRGRRTHRLYLASFDSTSSRSTSSRVPLGGKFRENCSVKFVSRIRINCWKKFNVWTKARTSSLLTRSCWT